MKIQPMGDRILIKVIKIEEHKGIIIAQTATVSGSAAVGEVIGLGQGYLSDKKTDDGKAIWDSLDSKVGERIIFNARAGLALSPKYRLIHENEIIAKINDTGIDIGDELLSGDE